jgi:hypothetical protein
MLFCEQDEDQPGRDKAKNNGEAFPGQVQLVKNMDERFYLAREIVRVTKSSKSKGDVFSEKPNFV